MLAPTCASEEGIPYADAPSWCADSWCFVNAETCSNGVIPSTYFPDDNLSYSYNVCAEPEDEAEEGEGDEEGESGDEASGEDVEASGNDDEASGNDEASGDDDEVSGDDEASGDEDDSCYERGDCFDETEEDEINPFGDSAIFDALEDFIINGLPEPEEPEEPEQEEDCSCLITSGVSPTFTPDGEVFITYVGDMGGEYKWAPNYGLTQCAAHDFENAPFCADLDGNPLVDAPAWCIEPWCYVNAETCTQGVTASTYFPDANLSYSYDVCAE